MALHEIAVGDEIQDVDGAVYEVAGVCFSRGLLMLKDSNGIERTMKINAVFEAIESGQLELLIEDEDEDDADTDTDADADVDEDADVDAEAEAEESSETEDG